MAAFDSRLSQIVVRIVYDGPGTAGKTTNLTALQGLFTRSRRGELVTPETTQGRTLYFDHMPLEGGLIAGHRFRCELWTVPGQDVLRHRRDFLLSRADVVVFVVDSRPSGIQDALPLLATLRASSGGFQQPLVVQANKQDCSDALPPDEVRRVLELDEHVPLVAAVAHNGQGVRDTTLWAMRLAAMSLQPRVIEHGPEALGTEVELPEETHRQMRMLPLAVPRAENYSTDPPTGDDTATWESSEDIDALASRPPVASIPAAPAPPGVEAVAQEQTPVAGTDASAARGLTERSEPAGHTDSRPFQEPDATARAEPQAQEPQAQEAQVQEAQVQQARAQQAQAQQAQAQQESQPTTDTASTGAVRASERPTAPEPESLQSASATSPAVEAVRISAAPTVVPARPGEEGMHTLQGQPLPPSVARVIPSGSGKTPAPAAGVPTIAVGDSALPGPRSEAPKASRSAPAPEILPPSRPTPVVPTPTVPGRQSSPPSAEGAVAVESDRLRADEALHDLAEKAVDELFDELVVGSERPPALSSSERDGDRESHPSSADQEHSPVAEIPRPRQALQPEERTAASAASPAALNPEAERLRRRTPSRLQPPPPCGVDSLPSPRASAADSSLQTRFGSGTGRASLIPEGMPVPTLPSAEVRSFNIWPPASGRETLRLVPFDRAEYRPELRQRKGKEDGSGKADTYVYRAGTWCLKTSAQRCYPDEETGRGALVQLARRKVGLGDQLPPHTVLVVQESDEGHWLWTVSPWLRSLRFEMTEAEAIHSHAALSTSLCSYAQASVAALTALRDRQVVMDVHPSNFARVGQQLVYLDDDIGIAVAIPTIGHSWLKRVEEYRNALDAVERYVSELEEQIQTRLSRHDVVALDLEASVAETSVHSELALEARTRLLSALATCA